MEQRALARAGSAPQREEFPAPQFQVHAAQHLQRALAKRVGLVDAVAESNGGSHS